MNQVEFVDEFFVEGNFENYIRGFVFDKEIVSISLTSYCKYSFLERKDMCYKYAIIVYKGEI